MGAVSMGIALSFRLSTEKRPVETVVTRLSEKSSRRCVDDDGSTSRHGRTRLSAQAVHDEPTTVGLDLAAASPGCLGGARLALPFPGSAAASRAIGAVVARFVHTEEVTGSNPVSPTK